MNKITRTVYDSYRASLEITISRSQHNLLTRMVTVNCDLAQEIGMVLRPEVVSQLKDLPPGTNASTSVKLIDYANAMEAYGQSRWGIPPIEEAFIADPVTPSIASAETLKLHVPEDSSAEPERNGWPADNPPSSDGDKGGDE